MKKHSDPAVVGGFIVLGVAFLIIMAASIASGVAAADRCGKYGGVIARNASGAPYCAAKVPR